VIGAPAAYWSSRLVFERALAGIYLIAFLDAVNEFVPLLGARGLMPVSRFVRAVPFQESPSLFFLSSSDATFRIAAWAGVALSCLVLTGLPSRLGALAAGAVWGALWVLYLSFVNVGQTFYGFGWESLLLEVGFFAMFLGGTHTPPNPWLRLIFAWTLFRLMFGAGLIKLRGDPCWRNLTCLDAYFETQPMPNPLSWYFHWLPAGVHRAGVAFNHFAELVVPFFYFAPQPLASFAAIATILFQGVLILSGNLSWLNWLTVVLCVPLLDDRWWSLLPGLPITHAAPVSTSPAHATIVAVLAAVVALLSIGPVWNMLSPGQLMNASFNPFHLVNTYGAFGSITKTRYEIVIEGTRDPAATDASVWQPYEFRGKPGDPSRRPPQIAPYHLRLDWLMWFEAMSPVPADAWFLTLLDRLRANDPAVTSLLATNPFAGAPPALVRARYYLYRFTTPDERRRTGEWWHRELVGDYVR
jgi:hypothetical protein